MEELNEFQKLAIAFGQCFSTESGQKVLAEFRRVANRPSYEPGIEDPERAPFWHEGRRSVLLLCEYMIEQGAKAMDAITAKDDEALKKVAGQAVSILNEGEEE